MNNPIVWTIAGSDCSGGAGIQADLHTFHALGVHGCSVITALTAQNSRKLHRIEFCSPSILSAQLEALSSDLPPKAIKLGMIGHLPTLSIILPFLNRFATAVVYDPVLFASVGGALHDGKIHRFLTQYLLPHITVLTPNIPEAEWLLGCRITTNNELEDAAKTLQSMGPRIVVLKGGHSEKQQNTCQDFWTDGSETGWLSSPRLSTPHRHGTGCTLASAIAATLAKGYAVQEALVLAKAYINQGLRLSSPLGDSRGAIAHHGWPMQHIDYPLAVSSSSFNSPKQSFPSCGPHPLGFYPIVPNANWIKRLLDCGVNTMQLRIKEATEGVLHREIETSIALAKTYNARLFINDYWQYALAYGAYGVHLGQEDLAQADWQALHTAGIRLGISTHSYYELARALAYQPSYIACGPIYPTQSKIMQAKPQGLARLKAYCALLECPVVAIGGINLENAVAIIKTGAAGVALISALTLSQRPEQEIYKWLKLIDTHQKEASLCSS